MNFASGPQKKMCSMCGGMIEIGETKAECERHTMHVKCFTCAICDCALKQGSCSRDDGIMHLQFMTNHRKGAPVWFCKDHMFLGTGEKHELLKKKYGKK